MQTASEFSINELQMWLEQENTEAVDDMVGSKDSS